MNLRERLLLGVGVALGLVGSAIAFVPALAPDVRVVSVFVAAIALLALGAAVAIGVARYRDDSRPLALPAPEGRASAVPGDEIDRRIAALSTRDPREDGPPESHERLRERVGRAARWVLSRDGLDAERVREQVADGTWTDDPRAAAFLADAPAARPSLRERLRGLRTGEPTVARRARHAIGALDRRHHRRSPMARSGDRTSDDPNEDESDEPSIRVRSLSAEARGSDRADGEPDAVSFPAPGETIERRTGRWRGASAVALAVGAAGIVLRRPGLLLASAVCVGVAAYARAATPPTIALDIERRVNDASPDLGDAVEVTVSVRNVGDRTCPDCVVIDGVPQELVVSDGSPRHGAALRPGKATTFSYTLDAARGEHRFEPANVVSRDFSGGVERIARIEVSGATTITCIPRLESLEEVPLRAHAMRFGGRMATDATEGGVEFHATREYRPSDSRARIDWNRLAKTGDLSTVEFRAERVPTVVAVIDARREAFLAPTPDGRSAVDRSVEAAGRTAATLLDGATRVGIGALSTHPERCWLAPDAGSAHRERVRQLLGTHPALAAYPDDDAATPTAGTSSSAIERDSGDGDGASMEWLRRRLPTDAQVIVVTPLCDDEAVEWIRAVHATGRAVTVICPDPTASSSPGRQLASIERASRISALRSVGIPVLDRDRTDDEPLSVAVQRLHARGVPRVTDRGANARGATR